MKKKIDIFTQNIDCGYRLEPHCRAKIRKIGIPLHTHVLLYKSGGSKGYTLHGHVFLMNRLNIQMNELKEVSTGDLITNVLLSCFADTNINIIDQTDLLID